MASNYEFTAPRLETFQATPVQERSYLLLEDLVDSPIEWTLCDVNAPSAPAARALPATSFH